jgi:hypothetical protein
MAPKHLGVGFAIASSVAVTLGSGVQAQAQIDPNVQSRAQSYTIPLTVGIAETQFGSVSGPVSAPDVVAALKKETSQDQFNENNIGACLTDPPLIFLLYAYNGQQFEKEGYLWLSPHLKQILEKDRNNFKAFSDDQKEPGIAADAALAVGRFFTSDKAARSHIRDAIIAYKAHLNELVKVYKGRSNELIKIITPFQIGYCGAKSVVKAIAPFNPTDETNVLKSNQNNSPGTSWGYGGTLQAFVPVTTPTYQKGNFDVIGFSAQSQSVRYNQYPTKSFDSITTQGAYQLFLGASGYQSDGLGHLVFVPTIKPLTDKDSIYNIPPAGMITVDSVAFGFQNQTVYTPTFSKESVNLFTPQITFNEQNRDLSGVGLFCKAAIPDPRKDGFCYYADFSFTVGQSFADVASQQNANVAISVTPGMRLPFTDLKLTLPATVTGRDYEDVIGGREDMLLQIGPALTYSPPPFTGRSGESYTVTFSLPATYNQNYSTVAADAWHGVIVMPTLTVAFQPPPLVK